MGWLYQGKQLNKLPDGVIGFVYCIYYTNNKKYIGKKLAVSERKKPLGKKELALQTDGRLKKHKHVTIETNWQSYNGSTKESEGLTILSKVITHLCTNKMSLTYLEASEMIKNDVLFRDDYLNKNILGKFYDNALDGLYKPEDNKTFEQPTLF